VNRRLAFTQVHYALVMSTQEASHQSLLSIVSLIFDLHVQSSLRAQLYTYIDVFVNYFLYAC